MRGSGLLPGAAPLRRTGGACRRMRHRSRRGWAALAAGLPAETIAPAQVQITSFSVGPDQSPTYPQAGGDPNRLVNLADEHSTFTPLGLGLDAYLLFASANVASSATGGASCSRPATCRASSLRLDWAMAPR